MTSVIIGVDGGTESLRVTVFDLSGQELGVAHAPYATQFPAPSQAEQSPQDWWRALCAALPEAVHKAGVSKQAVCAITLDTTCCTVCALDENGEPLRPALLWMDLRAAQEAADVLATADPALIVNNGGAGPVSAEWMIPKALWLKRHQPDIYARAATICEYQDYLNFRLTGEITASVNNAGVRWHVRSGGEGPPRAMLRALDLEDLLDKWPRTFVDPGAIIAPLSRVAAEALNLPAGIPVVQGGADAFIAMAGVGVVRPGSIALITGSSHLQLGVTDAPLSGAGIWGSYPDVLRRGGFVVEGGQTSTGSIINWFRRTLAANASYAELDHEAAQIPMGCDGLTAQDHFQGNRTPYTDPASRGAFTGLSLKHTRGHMFRALLESVAFGTKLVLETMRASGVAVDEIALCGGVARSDLWTQLHADVIGRPIKVSQACAPALGSAMFAAIGADIYRDLDEAAGAMVSRHRVVEPRAGASDYADAYAKYHSAYAALKGIHA